MKRTRRKSRGISDERLKAQVEALGREIELMTGKSLPRRDGPPSAEDLKKSAERLGQPPGR